MAGNCKISQRKRKKKREIIEGGKIFVQIYGQKNSIWAPLSDVKVGSASDMSIIGNELLELKGNKKLKDSWALYLQSENITRSTSIGTVKVLFDDPVELVIDPKNNVLSNETTDVVNPLVQTIVRDAKAISQRAYYPCQGEVTVKDVIENDGIIVVNIGHSFLEEKKIRDNEWLEKIEKVNKVQSDVMKQKETLIEITTSTGYNKLVVEIEKMNKENEEWKKEFHQKNVELEQKNVELEQKNVELLQKEEEVRVLLQTYQNPLHKVWIGSLYYLAKDKVLLFLYNNHFNRQETDIFSVYDSQEDEVKNFVEQLQIKKGHFENKYVQSCKNKRDKISHQPRQDSIRSALNLLPQDKLEILDELYNFVFP